MNFKSFSKAILALIVLSVTSCEKDTTTIHGKFAKGVFIVNEGNFTNGNASVSFFDRDSLTVTNDIFDKINGRPLGDVAQSMNEFNEKYYIVVNNSSKVEIVNSSDFVSTGVINGFALPRYFLGINSTLR